MDKRNEKERVKHVHDYLTQVLMEQKGSTEYIRRKCLGREMKWKKSLLFRRWRGENGNHKERKEGQYKEKRHTFFFFFAFHEKKSHLIHTQITCVWHKQGAGREGNRGKGFSLSLLLIRREVKESRRKRKFFSWSKHRMKCRTRMIKRDVRGRPVLFFSFFPFFFHSLTSFFGGNTAWLWFNTCVCLKCPLDKRHDRTGLKSSFLNKILFFPPSVQPLLSSLFCSLFSSLRKIKGRKTLDVKYKLEVESPQLTPTSLSFSLFSC